MVYSSSAKKTMTKVLDTEDTIDINDEEYRMSKPQ